MNVDNPTEAVAKAMLMKCSPTWAARLLRMSEMIKNSDVKLRLLEAPKPSMFYYRRTAAPFVAYDYTQIIRQEAQQRAPAVGEPTNGR